MLRAGKVVLATADVYLDAFQLKARFGALRTSSFKDDDSDLPILWADADGVSRPSQLLLEQNAPRTA